MYIVFSSESLETVQLAREHLNVPRDIQARCFSCRKYIFAWRIDNGDSPHEDIEEHAKYMNWTVMFAILLICVGGFMLNPTVSRMLSYSTLPSCCDVGSAYILALCVEAPCIAESRTLRSGTYTETSSTRWLRWIGNRVAYRYVNRVLHLFSWYYSPENRGVYLSKTSKRSLVIDCRLLSLIDQLSGLD